MNVAIITAAGKGTRLRSNVSKQFLNIYGKPILAHTINIFQRSPKINEIYISVPEDHEETCRKDIIEKFSFTKVKKLVIGGKNRQESVHNALIAIPSTSKIVLIHDGVRPLVATSEIEMTISRLISGNKKDPKVKGMLHQPRRL